MAEKSTHGGARPGAGRKKTGTCRDVPHRKRPTLSGKHAVHVSIRFRVRRSHRTRDIYQIISRALRRVLGRKDFRICHVSIQHSHLHLIIRRNPLATSTTTTRTPRNV